MGKYIRVVILITIFISISAFIFSLAKKERDHQPSKCGLENCHGLEIKCGSNPVDMCTEMYAIGDKCRQYATCGIVNGVCGQTENPKFTACKTCVENCTAKYATDSSMRILDCESNCE